MGVVDNSGGAVWQRYSLRPTVADAAEIRGCDGGEEGVGDTCSGGGGGGVTIPMRPVPGDNTGYKYWRPTRECRERGIVQGVSQQRGVGVALIRRAAKALGEGTPPQEVPP